MISEFDIQVGKWYRAKKRDRPDRFIIWISQDRKIIQFDGDEVRIGMHYPKRTMDQFLKWCGGTVNDP